MRNSYGLQWMAVVNQRDHPLLIYWAQLGRSVHAEGRFSGRKVADKKEKPSCQRQLTGVKIVAKKKPGDEPGVFFACYKRNKFIC